MNKEDLKRESQPELTLSQMYEQAGDIPQGEWLYAQSISNKPEVDEAIRGLLEDITGDNATNLVREVIRAVQSQPNYRYFIREIGEGDWQEVTYSRYAEAAGDPHTDYKREGVKS